MNEEKEKIREYRKRFYLKNKEKLNEKYRQWRLNNIEKAKECDREYYRKNKEKRLRNAKQWRGANPERAKEYNKQYYQKNKESILAKKKKIRDENPEILNERNKKWRENNLEHAREYGRKWIKTKKGKARTQRTNSKRRAILKEIINTLTADEWIDILKQYKFKCAYCGKEFNLFDRPTRDHVIPISKGGNNIKENIIPACRSCNASKSNKILDI